MKIITVPKDHYQTPFVFPPLVKGERREGGKFPMLVNGEGGNRGKFLTLIKGERGYFPMLINGETSIGIRGIK